MVGTFGKGDGNRTVIYAFSAWTSIPIVELGHPMRKVIPKNGIFWRHREESRRPNLNSHKGCITLYLADPVIERGMPSDPLRGTRVRTAIRESTIREQTLPEKSSGE